uniref:tRNA pseudouridine(55) synthase n=1 Tax=Spodoptera frugiperda TaxID=7108 RepID=A0A2H1W737_SPOFR
MNQKAIIKLCKDLGCCDACCLRYLGLKNPTAYENVEQFVHKICEESGRRTQDTETRGPPAPLSEPMAEQNSTDQCLEPPTKRIKVGGICVSCLGVLQEENWQPCCDMVKQVLDKKGYECETFACALSAPIAALVRERLVALQLKHDLPEYDDSSVTPLKEAWKWSFGVRLAEHIGKTLDSGAVSPLLITLHMEYPDELQELEALKALAPALFEARRAAGRRFGVEFTRRAAEQALAGATRAALAGAGVAGGPPAARARCVSVACAHAPLYLAGRYVKLSRALPQTPWLVNGRRMMHSSVQEIIFEPIAALYRLSPEAAEHRLKFMSAGREDVDVRCLGDGRPFAVEVRSLARLSNHCSIFACLVTDPTRQPSEAELKELCEQISAGGQVVVRSLVPIHREQLALLKKGEETKCKTYEALCIKLSHSRDDLAEGGGDVRVTPRDIAALNAYRNTAPGDSARVQLTQRTPIRVLHRRPLLARARRILELRARAVPAHPALLALRLRTEAGTYVKEWAHGELGRTRPSLADALGARVDILALDVAAVELPWPPAAPPAPPAPRADLQ